MDASVSNCPESLVATDTLPRKRGRPPLDEAASAQRREVILDQAALVFARDGYQRTDVQVVADALQVGKGTVYRYFPSKEALFLAAVDRGMRRMKEFLQVRLDGVADPLDRLAVGVRTYLTFFQEHPHYVELLIQERAEFRDRPQQTYFAHRDAEIGLWQQMFEDLMAAGRVRRMPVGRILDVLGDLTYGTMFTNYFAGHKKSPRDQAGDILDVVFHGILTSAGRARHGRSRTGPGGRARA